LDDSRQISADPIITIAQQPSAPRFLSFLGVEAPPIHELLGEADKGFTHLPLHIKPDAIGRITATERAIILALPFATPGRKERLTEILRWLHDAKLYEALQAARPPGRRTGRTALKRKQTSLLVRLGKLDIDNEPAAAGCECNLFTVPEVAKGRLRIILESLCNDWIYKSDLSRFKLPTRDSVRTILRGCRYRGGTRPFVIALDAAAWFDQFLLDPAVRRYFRVAGGFLARVLAMGFRAACDVAQATAEALADFELSPGVHVIVYIDNFFIIGHDEEAVLSAAERLLERCDSANVLLNDLPPASSPADRRAWLRSQLARTTVDILGETYDLEHLTATITASTRSKLVVAAEKLKGNITIRQWAAVFGVVLFADSVFASSRLDHWLAMRAFSDVARQGAASGWRGKELRSLPPDALTDLAAWISDLLAAPPLSLEIPPTPEVPDVDLIIDASSWGTGVVCAKNGSTTLHSIPWSAAESRALATSSFASSRTEPCAAVRAAVACVPHSARLVRVNTDHEGLVHASRRGHAKSWAYNETLRRLRSLFPHTRFVFHFIPGKTNVTADWLSRGRVGAVPQCLSSSAIPSVRVG
jgi:hypothetical protein